MSRKRRVAPRDRAFRGGLVHVVDMVNEAWRGGSGTYHPRSYSFYCSGAGVEFPTNRIRRTTEPTNCLDCIVKSGPSGG